MGTKRWNPGHELGKRYNNSARRLGVVRAALIAASQGLVGSTEQATSERAGDKQEAREGVREG